MENVKSHWSPRVIHPIGQDLLKAEGIFCDQTISYPVFMVNKKEYCLIKIKTGHGRVIFNGDIPVDKRGKF
jgi:hypothetical protein